MAKQYSGKEIVLGMFFRCGLPPRLFLPACCVTTLRFASLDQVHSPENAVNRGDRG